MTAWKEVKIKSREMLFILTFLYIVYGIHQIPTLMVIDKKIKTYNMDLHVQGTNDIYHHIGESEIPSRKL
jgi:hypothetical protein